ERVQSGGLGEGVRVDADSSALLATRTSPAASSPSTRFRSTSIRCRLHSLLRGLEKDPKTDDIVAIPVAALNAGTRPHQGRPVQEGPPANDVPLTFLRRPRRVRFRRFRVEIALIPVPAELADVAEHVVEPEGVGLETAHRRGERVAVVPGLKRD